jgi:hypothetical protein
VVRAFVQSLQAHLFSRQLIGAPYEGWNHSRRNQHAERPERLQNA